MAGDSAAGDRSPDPSATQVRCHCGAVLADRIDGRTVVIDGVEYQFRRRTDKLTCPDCGHDHPRRTLRPGLQDAPKDTGQRRRRDDRA
ncbi:MAG: hypothetical protein ACLFS9_11475 [Nitriliruptoraceae bacterium]